MTILVTGVAGFIGFHLAQRLLKEEHHVVGLDNLNSYYSVELKRSRLEILSSHLNFLFHQINIVDKGKLDGILEKNSFDSVVHLAAQAGVRHSMTHPYDYLENNLHGFLNVLEACRHNRIKHLIYASSSSVYGANGKLPFSVHDHVDHPLSLYAASKKSNELMAHTYSALYGIPTTGLRFFSAYGTYGRPDMALFLFTRAILEGSPIEVFNEGKMRRDFTYVDDIVECIMRLIPNPPKANPQWDKYKPDPATSFAQFRLYNVGNNRPVELMRYIEIIEEKLNKRAIKKLMPLQDGDVPEALADIDDLIVEIDFKPSTSIEEGIGKFVDWYLDYYNMKN